MRKVEDLPSFACARLWFHQPSVSVSASAVVFLNPVMHRPGVKIIWLVDPSKSRKNLLALVLLGGLDGRAGRLVTPVGNPCWKQRPEIRDGWRGRSLNGFCELAGTRN